MKRRQIPDGHIFKEGQLIQAVITFSGQETVYPGKVQANPTFVYGHAGSKHKWLLIEPDGARGFSFDDNGDINSRIDSYSGYVEIQEE